MAPADVAAALDRLSVAMFCQRASAADVLPDVNATDLLALTIIHRAGQITPGDLAATMRMTGGGANGVVRRVIDAGLLDRVAWSHTDVRLEVTQRGEALVTTEAGGWESELLEELESRSDSADVIDLLAALAEAIEQRSKVLAELAADADRAAHPTIRLPLRWG